VWTVAAAAAGAQGLGEGVALPSMNNMVAAHVPPSAKARALGMSFTGFHTGTAGVGGLRHSLTQTAQKVPLAALCFAHCCGLLTSEPAVCYCGLTED
jgi:MFS family permease